MPYISQGQRTKYDDVVAKIVQLLKENDFDAGELNYIIYKIMKECLADTTRYVTVCKIMGTLHCVASEFYRMDAAPYEDEKRLENGPIE